VAPFAVALAQNSSTSLDLPIPGSPVMRKTLPRPDSASPSPDRRISISRPRPTKPLPPSATSRAPDGGGAAERACGVCKPFPPREEAYGAGSETAPPFAYVVRRAACRERLLSRARGQKELTGAGPRPGSVSRQRSGSSACRTAAVRFRYPFIDGVRYLLAHHFVPLSRLTWLGKPSIFGAAQVLGTDEKGVRRITR
jgi:hypothetical protein